MSLTNLNAPYNYLGLLNITNNNVDAINANDIKSNTIENSLTITTKNLVVTSTSVTNGITNTGSISTTGDVSSNSISTNSILALTEISSPSYVGYNINVTGDITGGLTNTITGYNLVANHNITASALTTTNTLKVNSTSITNGISNTGSISSGTLTSTGLTTANTLQVNSTSNTNGINNTGSISSTTLTSTGLTTANTLQVNSTSNTNGISNTGSISSGTLTSTGLTTANTLQVNSTSNTNGISNTGSISSGTLTSTGLTTANTLQVNSTSTTNGINNTGSINSTSLISNSLSSQSGTNTISLYPQFTSYQNYNFKKLSSISNSGFLESIYTENHSIYSNYAELAVSDGTANYNINKQFYSNSYNFYSYPSGKCISNEAYNGTSTLRLTINDLSGCIIPNLYCDNYISTTLVKALTFKPSLQNYSILYNGGSTNQLFRYDYTFASTYSNSGIITTTPSASTMDTDVKFWGSSFKFDTYPSGTCLTQNGDASLSNRLYISSNNILFSPSTSNKQKLLSVNDNALFQYYYTNATVNSAGVSNAGQLIISAGGGSDNFNASSVNYAYTHDFQVYPSGYCVSNDCNFGSSSRFNISNSSIIINDLSGNGFFNSNPSLIFNHTADAASSIYFNSKNNLGSDFACIEYRDNVSGTSGGEKSRLMIAVQNDPISIYQDFIFLSSKGGILINSDITSSNLPAYDLDIQGNIGQLVPPAYTYSSIPTLTNKNIGYTNNVTFSRWSLASTGATYGTDYSNLNIFTVSDFPVGIYQVNIKLILSASVTALTTSLYYSLSTTLTPNYKTNPSSLLDRTATNFNIPASTSAPYYCSFEISGIVNVTFASTSIYNYLSFTTAVANPLLINGTSTAYNTNAPYSTVSFTRIA